MFKILFEKLFCLHDYQLVNQFEMKSEFDIIVEAGKVPTSVHSITRMVEIGRAHV